MAGIYQEIWNADQNQNGLDAMLDTENGSKENGYVKVNSKISTSSDPELRVITEVHIPKHKKLTYDLCRKLFNNYTLAEPMPEIDTAEERQEVHAFVSALIETEAMEVARMYVERESGSTITRQRWYNTIIEMWFRRFSSGGDPELSGFEHVVVGEQEKSKAQGYHFWWKYYLDDGFARQVDGDVAIFPGLVNDRIIYHGSKQKKGQMQFPQSVTISYRWNAPDYEGMAIRPLFKKIGGFFVGCSIEGLLALGTVRAHKGIRAPRTANIEGARYDMKLFHSPNGQQIRTFYPMFLGQADIADGGGRGDAGGDSISSAIPSASNAIRIIGSTANPKGRDTGLENVTLVNVNAVEVDLSGWSVRDKNANSHLIEGIRLKAGEFRTIRFTGKNVQLSNKGGSIELLDRSQTVVHRVSYSKAQANNQGGTILF
ncbi:MAG: lamin tail domain-containing protein [Thiohalomonadales bacterium]